MTLVGTYMRRTNVPAIGKVVEVKFSRKLVIILLGVRTDFQPAMSNCVNGRGQISVSGFADVDSWP